MAFPDERVAVVVLTNQDSVDYLRRPFTPPASWSQRYEMVSPAESLRLYKETASLWTTASCWT
jgi:hypothetical protein